METEGDTKDEHSYAYSNRRRAFEGKVKDHCYTSKYSDVEKPSKRAHKTGVQQEHSYSLYRSMHSMSEEDVSQIKEDSIIFKGLNYQMLPHYQSSDSALDVTGYDSISEKCLSSENINVKTIDVFTDKCISHFRGISDPDISKMTLQSHTDSSPCGSYSIRDGRNEAHFDEERMIMDHNYSSFSKKNFKKSDVQNSVLQQWSPIFDHSYDMSPHRPLHDHSYNSKLKNKTKDSSTKDHDIEKLNKSWSSYLYMPMRTNASAVTKSPFLDHTYQSVEEKRTNVKYLGVMSPMKSSFFLYGNKKQTGGISRMKRGGKSTSEKTCFSHLDHTYEKTGEVHAGRIPGRRFRSNSMTEFPVNDSSIIYDADLSDCSSSDSGTESLNEENCNEMPMVTDAMEDDMPNDHSYVYQANTL